MEVVQENRPLLDSLEDPRTDFGATNDDDDDHKKDDGEEYDDNDGDASVLSVPAMVEAVEEAVEALAEAVAEEAHDVAEVVIEEFQDANESNFHYLEMGLTRNLSILPGDVVDVATGGGPLSVLGDDISIMSMDTDKMEVVATPPSAYFLLATAVVSLSSIGPLLVLQENATPSMKIIWRMTGTSMLLLPMAGYDLYTKGGIPKLTSPQWFTFLLATMCYDVMTLAFVISLTYTAVGNAVILSNSLTLILLVGKVFVGDPVSLLEGAGAMVAFGGAALCSKDSADNMEASNTLLGDALAMLSAVGGVGYLIFAKSVRSHVPLYIFMFLTMAGGAVILIIFQVFVLGEEFSFDMHYSHGIWGFLTPVPDRLPLELVTVLICNLCGTMGYVRAMQYFGNLVISSAALMEPVTAEFMTFAFGVGQLPGYEGWIGNLLVAGGTFAVIYQDGKGKSPAAH